MPKHSKTTQNTLALAERLMQNARDELMKIADAATLDEHERGLVNDTCSALRARAINLREVRENLGPGIRG